MERIENEDLLEDVTYDYDDALGSFLYTDWESDVPYGAVEKVYYAKGTVHFRRRQFDKSYEILAKSLGIPDSILNSESTGNRWIVLDVVKTHDDALKAIKKWRQ